MASLCVPFAGPVEAAVVWQALRREGLADAGRVPGRATLVPLEIGGWPIEVRVVPMPLATEALVDAARHAPYREAEPLVGAHAAHVRLESPQTDGPGLSRLEALTRAAGALLPLPGALALVCEEGAAITPAGQALSLLDRRARDSIPPVDLWIGLRRFRVADAPAWFLDTVGMAQLGLRDLEAYAEHGEGAEAVSAWLRNLSLHLVQESATSDAVPLRSGDTLDGPDEEPWVTLFDEATAPPARPVLRFTPFASL